MRPNRAMRDARLYLSELAGLIWAVAKCAAACRDLVHQLVR